MRRKASVSGIVAHSGFHHVDRRTPESIASNWHEYGMFIKCTHIQSMELVIWNFQPAFLELFVKLLMQLRAAISSCMACMLTVWSQLDKPFGFSYSHTCDVTPICVSITISLLLYSVWTNPHKLCLGWRGQLTRLVMFSLILFSFCFRLFFYLCSCLS